MRGSGRNRSFTLVELLLVIAMISILSGVIFPRLSGMVSSVELEGAAELLAADLNWLRGEAILSRTRHRLLLAGNAAYALERQDASGKWLELLGRRLPAGVAVASTTFPGGSVTYDLAGQPDGGQASATLENRDRDRAAVTVLPGSGVAFWKRGT